jgi:AraC-like DNA-binding protein
MSIYDIIGTRRRVLLNLADYGLPEVPLLGVNIQSSATNELEQHVHKGCLELLYMIRGRQVFTVGGREYHVSGNQIFLTQPDVPHGSGSYIMQRSLFYWLHVSLPPAPQSILSLTNSESVLLSRALGGIGNGMFNGDKKIEVLFEELFKIALSPGSELQRLSMSSRLTELLLRVIECSRRENSVTVTAELQRVLDLIEANPGRYFSVDELAAAAGLSASRFKTKFKRRIGIPPAEYQLRKKIDNASQLLSRTTKTVTDIAYSLGFSSSQYFATVFKRYTMKTPIQYRRDSR